MTLKAFIMFSNYGLRTLLADRAMFITDFILAIMLPFVMQVLIWNAIYTDSSIQIENFTHTQILFYYALVLVIVRLNNGYDVILHLSQQIQEGKLEMMIVKPLSYPLQRLAVFMGESILYLIPVATVLILFYEQISLLTLGKFFILLIIAYLMSFVFALLLATATFWIVEYSLLLSFQLVAYSLLGGLLLPPSMWPNFLLPLMQYNPFRYMIAAPAEFIVSGNSALFIEALLGSLIYLAIFLLLFLLSWKRGLKIYTGAGG